MNHGLSIWRPSKVSTNSGFSLWVWNWVRSMRSVWRTARGTWRQVRGPPRFLSIKLGSERACIEVSEQAEVCKSNQTHEESSKVPECHSEVNLKLSKARCLRGGFVSTIEVWKTFCVACKPVNWQSVTFKGQSEALQGHKKTSKTWESQS